MGASCSATLHHKQASLRPECAVWCGLLGLSGRYSMTEVSRHVRRSGRSPALGAEAWRQPRLWLGVLAVVTVLAFHRVLFCGFVNWDDDIYVYDNPNLA